MKKKRPPRGATLEAKRAIEWANERGLKVPPIAERLAEGRSLTVAAVRAASEFFDRHRSDQYLPGFRLGDDGFPSARRIAWSLRGGDTLRAWAEDVVRTSGVDLTRGRLQERSHLMEGVERRFFGQFDSASSPDFEILGVEERAAEPGKPLQTYIVGYAATFGQDSVLLGDFIERIEPSAFDIVLAGKDLRGKPLQTRGLFNHDPNHLLGRYPTTMKLWVDSKGLKYQILLPESRKDIGEMIRRGDLRGSSFSFIVAPGGERWTRENGQSIRTVTKIKALVDCGPVTYPAYESSSVAVAQRSLTAFLKGERAGKAEARASIMAEVEKTRLWLLERRDCGQGADGKFGKGNTCASGGSSPGPKQISKTTGGTHIGKAAEVITKAAGTGAVVGGSFGAANAAASGTIAAAAEAGAHAGQGLASTIGAAAESAGVAIAKGAAAGAVAAAAPIAGALAGSAIGKWISPETDQNHILTAVAGLGAGLLGGAPIGAAVAAASGIGQALYGRYRQHTEEHLAKSKEDLGIDDKKVGRVKSMLDPGNENFVQKSFADGHVMFAGPAGEAHVFMGPSGKTSVHVRFEKGSGLGAKDSEKVASSLKAMAVYHEPSDKTVGFVDHDGDPLIKGNKVHMKDMKPVSKRYDELVDFLAERRAFCPTGEGGGVDNTCSPGKYMEWKEGDHKVDGKTEEAQKFIDKARKDQTITAGKDGGKSDDGGGVQTWSKGDHFPWTIKQVGDVDGHVQGIHPDGSQTDRYPFYAGDTSKAYKKVKEEITRRKKTK